MQSKLNPYLSFRDNARQAMQFYQTVFGGKLTVSTFKDFDVSTDPAEADKVMHSVLEAENGIVFMAADLPNNYPHSETTFISMSLSGDNSSELTGYYQKLAVGGKISVPLDSAPWGDQFGMVTDQFGVDWMVNISGKQA